MVDPKQENILSNKIILQNMNSFIEQEGFRVERLAKKMEIGPYQKKQEKVSNSWGELTT
jgi:hypothetical protein